MTSGEADPNWLFRYNRVMESNKPPPAEPASDKPNDPPAQGGEDEISG